MTPLMTTVKQGKLDASQSWHRGPSTKQNAVLDGQGGCGTLLFAGGSFWPGGGSRLGRQESALLSLSLSLRLSLENKRQRISISR